MIKHSLTLFFVLIVNFFLIDEALALSTPDVVIQAMADGEVQPKLLQDKQGRAHLIYFKIEDMKSRMGNLYYKQYISQERKWSKPIKISQKSYRRPDVIATAKMAVDGKGRLHVTWLSDKPTEYLYSRSDIQIEKFEAPRSMISKFLEGAEASAVISSHNNQVALTWMAGWDENIRTVYTRISMDNGKSFGVETMVGDQSIGGCGCCAYASDYSNDGELLVAYRSATNGSGRHMQLLTLKVFEKNTQLIDTWDYKSCPVSTNHMIQDNKNNTWITWETEGRIYTIQRNDKNMKSLLVSQTNNKIRQKHPVMAFNNTGYQLMAWSEGNGFFSGGELKLQMYDSQSKKVDTPSTKGMQLEQFSTAAVSQLDDGSFIVLH